MKSKEALKTIKNIELHHIEYFDDDYYDNNSIDSYEEYDGTIEENYPDAIKTIEKELKAFEIIKECKEVICLRKEYDEELYTPEEIEKEGGQKYYLEDGSDGYRCYELTKEKYDLLKEVLS